jgi:IclR family acetate operon transcriptional repressor
MRYKPVQSLQRGMAILDALASRREGMSLKELSFEAGCSSAATFHLVQTLVAAGYAQRLDGPVRYVLGDKFLHLTRNQQQSRLQRVVDKHLLYIQQCLPDASIYFSQYFGSQVMIRCRAVPQAMGIVQREINEALPPYVSAGSLIHMAWWTEDQRQTYLSQYSYETYGQHFWGTWKDYQHVLEATRKDGLALLPERVTSHLKIGLPVLGATGVLQGAITIQWNQPTTRNLAARRKKIKQLAAQVRDLMTAELTGENE